MLKRLFHITLLAALALNLSGAAALTSAFDCGMDCCKPAAWTGTMSFETSTCCDMEGVTCGFETGRVENLLYMVLVRSNSITSANSLCNNLPNVVSANTSAHPRTFTLTYPLTGSLVAARIYLSNAAILC